MDKKYYVPGFLNLYPIYVICVTIFKSGAHTRYTSAFIQKIVCFILILKNNLDIIITV